MNAQPDSTTPSKALVRIAALIGLGLVGAANLAIYLSPGALKWATQLYIAPEGPFSWLASGLIWVVVVALITSAIRRSGRAAVANAAPGTAGRLRLLNALSLVLLFVAAFAVTFLLVLAAAAIAPEPPPGPVGDGFSLDNLMSNLTFNFGLVIAGMWSAKDAFSISILFGVPLAMTALAWRSGARSPRWGMAGIMVLAPIFVYLATDDAEARYAISYSDLSPVRPGMAESYAVLMQWSNRSENVRRFKDSPPPSLSKLWPRVGFKYKRLPAISDAAWPQWARDNRELLAQVDRELPELRIWWETWNAFPEVGDLTKTVYDPVLDYRPIRLFTQMACAEATCRAQEGRGDAAFEALLPLAIGAAKLQTSSRRVLRSMTAWVLREMVMDTAELVLRETPVSPAARLRLADALAGGQGGELLARRLIAMEFTDSYDTWMLSREKVNAMPGWFRLGPRLVVLNSNRTINEFGDLMMELQERAARRDIAGAKETVARFNHQVRTRWSIKNIGARTLYNGFFRPSLVNNVARYWAVEDKGAALIARLKEPAHEAQADTTATGGTP